MMSRAEPKKTTKKKTHMVWWNFFLILKFAMIFLLNHHFPICWSAQFADDGHAWPVQAPSAGGAFGKSICSNVLKGLPWLYIYLQGRW